MANKLPFHAEIKVDGEFTVGLDKVEKTAAEVKQKEIENKFDLVIGNQEDFKVPPGMRLFFYLTGWLRDGERALFFKQTDAKSCEKKATNGFSLDWNFPSGGDGFELRIFPPATSQFFKKGVASTITLSKVKSSTIPGIALLEFRVELTSSPKLTDTEPLTIQKVKAQEGAILYFYPHPPGKTAVLRGQDVTLKWRTVGLKTLELKKAYIAIDGVNYRKDEDSHTAKNISARTVFSLSAPPFTSEITIDVVPAGWTSAPNKIWPGDAALPLPKSGSSELDKEMAELRPYEENGLALQPAEIIDAKDSLYGIFRNQSLEKQTVQLFETGDDFGQWTLVDCQVPEGFDENPAVYFQEQIWLVGGSRIDPDRTSNMIQRFDPKNKTSPSTLTAPWRARMGHAVLLVQKELWVMGGRDSAGNALNDVWRANYIEGKNELTWSEVKTSGEKWSRRCLFNPVAFLGNIWVYGGAKEPFSRDVYSDLWTYSIHNNTWEQQDRISNNLKQLVTDPIASCLQVFGGKLHVFGIFRKSGGGFEVMAYYLDNLSEGNWKSFPSESLKAWGSTSTFSLQVLNFKDRYLTANALALGEKTADLRVYVGD